MKSPATSTVIGLAGLIMVPMLCIATSAYADIIISSDPTSNMSCSSGVCTPSSSSAVLNAGDLQTMLASGNVKLAAAGEPVDVDISAALSWVSTSKLTLDSYHSINVNQPIAINGGGGLALIANDGGTGGTFAFMPGANVAFLGLSGSLMIDGSTYTLVDNIAMFASDIAANPGGSYALAGNYDATPDGTYPSSPITTEFAGNFQGLGNTISHLTVTNNTKGQQQIGLFSTTGSSGVISNINLQGANIGGSQGSIGGVVGQNAGVLFGDHVVGGSIKILGHQGAVGGLVGLNGGTVAASSATATVSGSGFDYVGGLVGYAGFNSGAIETSYATGASKAGSDGNVGGLVGNVDGGTVTNCYSTGAANGGNGAHVGGLAGILQESDGMIVSSYSTGRVKGKTEKSVGGFLGQFDAGTISGSYWDTNTSKTKNPVGGSSKLPGVTGLTTKQLQSGLPAGFAPTVWAESPSINNGFPYLIANPPQ
jgi:hypothetical protein